MNILVPISSGGERTDGEPSFTSTPWNQLSETEQATHLVNICHDLSDVCLEFSPDEALKLQQSGVIKTDIIAQYFEKNLLSVTTQSRLDNGVGLITFLAQYIPLWLRTSSDGLLLGTIPANKLANILNDFILTDKTLTGPRPVNQ